MNDIGLLLKQKWDSDLEPIPGRNMMRCNYSFTCIPENFRNFSGIYIEANWIYISLSLDTKNEHKLIKRRETTSQYRYLLMLMWELGILKLTCY
jgi:hypothetical protein